MSTVSDTWKETLSSGIDFKKKEVWHFRFLYVLPVTTESKNRYAQHCQPNPNREIYHTWKLHDSIFHGFWQNGKANFQFLISYPITGNDFFQNHLTLLLTFLVFTTNINFKWNTLVIKNIIGIENLKLFFNITGSWRFNYRWGQWFWTIKNRPNNVV